MAANAKTRRKKKRRLKKGPVIIAVILLLSGIGFIVSLYHEQIIKKAKDIPNSFSYPTDYEEYVIKYSKKYDCDPVLVFSVIKVESGFDKDAVSSVGARGLMQLMEDAYDWIKYRLDDQRDNSYDDMFDPELNIQYGTYYLSYLMDKYDGSIELTAAAYHCGMSLVDSWIEDGTVDPDNFNENDIPNENDQTQNYVRKIRRAYDNYKDILANDGDITEAN
ncbi:lytic transglycosylase domain-containing protein [Ruminococcus sp.]|uniref:lytic transglycosylase domain-containing protein n=1 Tax=Ruminococcus sp. TaxID=41978 RepID=UPI0025D470E4|nr:lytic transglycosylase domain-containing protein [Ruminococcus sp.]